MLKAPGVPTLHYYSWQNAGIKRWDDLKDYYLGIRVSVTAVAGQPPAPDPGRREDVAQAKK